MGLRICLDANAALRAFAAPSSPQATIVRALVGVVSEIQHVSSPAILAEWRDNALKPSVLEYFARRSVFAADYVAHMEDLISVTEIVDPPGEAPPCRDETDRKYLHLAIAANLNFVITADRDLLDIQRIGSCEIVTAQEFLLWS